MFVPGKSSHLSLFLGVRPEAVFLVMCDLYERVVSDLDPKGLCIDLSRSLTAHS